MSRRNVPVFVKIDSEWVRVGQADQDRSNPRDVEVEIDADLETSRAAVKALIQGRAAIGFGPEPPEPHDDEYEPRSKNEIQLHLDPPKQAINPAAYLRPADRDAWPK